MADSLTVSELRQLLEKLEQNGCGSWLVEADSLVSNVVLAVEQDKKHTRAVLRCWHPLIK